MLLIAFGSVVAMGLPIVTALFGLFVGAAGVGVLSAFMDVPEFSLILCMMVGLGVGIDYALFIVTRHRQHLHDGMSVEDSAGTANATAGQAVLFAGTTVVIAILGLFLAGLPAMTSMGVAVALVVVVAMIAAITLLPGLLGLAGTKIDKLSIHRKSHVAKPPHETFSGRWAHHVGSHPVRYAVVSFVALCAIATPALSMRIGTPDDGNAAKDTTQRKAYDLLADGFGAGFNGPIQVVIEIPTAADQVAVDRVVRRAPGRSRRRRGHRAGVQRRRRHGDDDRQPDDGPAGRSAPMRSSITCAPTCSPSRWPAPTPARCSPARRWSPTSPSASRAVCRCSSLRSWRCRSCC